MYFHLIKDLQFWIVLLSAFPVWFVLFFTDFQIKGLNESSQFLSDFLFVGLLYPVIEELCFRGFIQTSLRKIPYLSVSLIGLSCANIFTSFLFAALHMFYQPLFMAMLVFIPSLVFGYFRDRYDSVVPAIILHVFYNCGWLLFSYVILSVDHSTV